MTYKRARVQDAVMNVCARVQAAGGRAFLVGGCVRDALLGVPLSDVDIEVFGVRPEALKALLSEHVAIDLVGEAFGVIKLRHLPVDVSLPRRESKSGLGHRAFEVLSDPFLSPREAASRRDFTINAISLDPLTGEIVDPFDGRADLERRLLRHTSAKFREDPLRVLRGMQFIARFGLRAAPETVEECRGIGMEGLAAERMFGEWKKLLLLGEDMSAGLAFLRATAWVRFFPECAALIGCEQDAAWHPEGDVWTHTACCLDAFARERIGDEWEDLVVGFGVLCHDFGKPSTSAVMDGRIRSLDHEAAGEAPTRAFLARLRAQHDLVAQVVPLVREHLKPSHLHDAQAGPAAIRRLARRVGRIDRLVRVARADAFGAPPRPPGPWAPGEWLLARAAELAVTSTTPQPIIKGRHLIALGLAPSPDFALLLQRCFEAQLDGEFTDEAGAIAYLTALLES